MIISHVKIIAFQTSIIHCLWIFYIARKDCSLYNKQNNTCVLGNTRFISRVKHDITRLLRSLVRYHVQHSKLTWYFRAPMYYFLFTNRVRVLVI